MNLNRAQMPDLGTNWRISTDQTFEHTSSPAHWLWVEDDIELRAVPGLRILVAPTWDALRLEANDWLASNDHDNFFCTAPDRLAIRRTGAIMPMGDLLNAVVQRHIELTKEAPAISRDDRLELALRRLIIRAKKEGGGAWSQVTGAVTLLEELT